MSVTLRLARHGAIHRPFYHLVAADHRMARNGRFIEKLGYYDPQKDAAGFEFNAERVQFWYGQGAEVSGTVAKLLKVKQVKLERAKTNGTAKAKTKAKAKSKA
jgi:small subunit ribosomal protein S16